MSMDIKDLALQPRMQVWHPNCIRSTAETAGASGIRRCRVFEIFRCALRQRMPAKRPALAHVVLFSGTQSKSRNTPVLACWSGAPKRSPNLGGSFL